MIDKPEWKNDGGAFFVCTAEKEMKGTQGYKALGGRREVVLCPVKIRDG